MISLTDAETLDRLADLLADKVAKRLNDQSQRVLVSREELAQLTGCGVRTIDRMASGGSWEKDKLTGKRVWRDSSVKLEPIKRGSRVLFDKAAALAAISKR